VLVGNQEISRWSFIAGGAASLAACAGAGGALSPLPGGSRARSLAKRVSAAPATTALGHTGYQLSSNAASTAFALHNSSGDYAASFAAGPRFIRSTYSDGSQLVLETDMPVTPHWYQLTNGIRFRFKKIKKTGSLGLLALDKTGNRLMIHVEKDTLHFSAPKRKGAKAKLPKGHLPRNRAEALDAFNSVMDNKGTWTGDDDFRGASGDYPAGTGWSIVPRKSGTKAGSSSVRARRKRSRAIPVAAVAIPAVAVAGRGAGRRPRIRSRPPRRVLRRAFPSRIRAKPSRWKTRRTRRIR
jgi:hypothetical protein